MPRNSFAHPRIQRGGARLNLGKGLQRMSRVSRSIVLAWVLVGLIAAEAGAASITGILFTENPDGNPGHYGDNLAPEPDDCNLGSCAGVTLFDSNDGLLAAPNGYAEWNSASSSSIGGGGSTFNANYDYYLSGQAGENAIFNANRHTALYYDPTFKIDITLNAAPAEQWTLDLVLGNSGSITFVNSAYSNSDGSGFITGVSGSGLSGASVAAGSLSFGSGASVSNAAGAWNDAGLVSLAGTGSSVISFVLDWNLELQIDGANYGSGTRRGDCFAFGGGLTSQGATQCSATGSGLSIDGTLTVIPEPTTSLLVMLGLVGLGVQGRRRRG